MHTYVHQDTFQNVHSSTIHSSQSQNYPQGSLPVEQVSGGLLTQGNNIYDEPSLTTCNNVGDSQTYCWKEARHKRIYTV